jgi:hypothetical protein
LSGNPISASVLKSVELEFVLCRMRNAAVTDIDAGDKGFDDADASRIADALRCAYGCASMNWGFDFRGCVCDLCSLVV